MGQLDFDGRCFSLRGCLLARHGLVIPFLAVPATSSGSAAPLPNYPACKGPMSVAPLAPHSVCSSGSNSPMVPPLACWGRLRRRMEDARVAGACVTQSRTISSPKSVAYCLRPRQRHRTVKNHFSTCSKETKTNNQIHESRKSKNFTLVSRNSVAIDGQVLSQPKTDPKAKVTHSGSTAPSEARSAVPTMAYWG